MHYDADRDAGYRNFRVNGGMVMKALSEAEWNIMESLWEESPKVSDHGGYGSEDGLEQKHYADHAEKDE